MSDRPPTEFERVCLPFLGDCHAFALSLTRRGPEADDLVQETYLRAFQAFASFRPGSHAKAWLFTILRRLHIDRYRRSRHQPQPLAQDALEESALHPATDPGPGGEAGAAAPTSGWERISGEEVRQAIQGVPEPFRTAVVLRDLHGLRYAEIGAILELPQGTVMSRLHRGREYVRQALVPLLGPPPPPRRTTSPS